MNGTRRSTRASQENQTDENARPARLTRAKSSQVVGKSIETANAAPRITRKRAALEDVSNQVPITINANGNAKKAIKPAGGPLRQKSSNLPVNVRDQRQVVAAKRKVKPAPLQPIEDVVNQAPSVSDAKHKRPLPSSPEIEIESKSLPSRTQTSPPALREVRVWDDLDADDVDDPLMVSEYVTEIFEYLREQEILTLPASDYINRQKGLNWSVRGVLVDWIIEVHQKFRLLPETLFLAINIVDRFLSCRVCTLGKIQLVGVTGLFIACKYEEVMCPSIHNFIYMADGGYGTDEILRAEQFILQTLDFNLSYPNPMNFLRRVSKADEYDIQVRTVGKYLLEISLVDHRFLVFPPSLAAAAGMYLARHMLDRGTWDANLEHFSGYTESELIGCVRLMIDFLRKPNRHDSFYKKYAARKFMKASLFVTQWVSKDENIEQFDGIVDTSDFVIEDDVVYDRTY